MFKTLIILIMLGNISCQAQTKKKMENNNPLMCDLESGICEIPTNRTNSGNTSSVKANKKP